MGMFLNPLGGSNPHKITAEELHKKVRSDLFSHGLERKDIDEIMQMLEMNLEPYGPEKDRGVDAAEESQIMALLRKNKGKTHNLDEAEMSAVDTVLKKYLNS